MTVGMLSIGTMIRHLIDFQNLLNINLRTVSIPPWNFTLVTMIPSSSLSIEALALQSLMSFLILPHAPLISF